MVAYNAPGWDNDESETLVNNSDEANNEINYRNFVASMISVIGA